MYQILSLKTSRIIFASFIVLLKKHAKSKAEFKYIAVPEWQKRGAIHFHLIVWGLPEGVENERFTHNIQRLWLRGFCHCVKTDGHPKIATYMSKYMFKSMQDPRLCGERAYSASHNVLRPVSVKSQTIDGYMDLIVGDNSPGHEKHYQTQWQGRAHYQLYNLT